MGNSQYPATTFDDKSGTGFIGGGSSLTVSNNGIPELSGNQKGVSSSTKGHRRTGSGGHSTSSANPPTSNHKRSPSTASHTHAHHASLPPGGLPTASSVPFVPGHRRAVSTYIPATRREMSSSSSPPPLPSHLAEELDLFKSPQKLASKGKILLDADLSTRSETAQSGRVVFSLQDIPLYQRFVTEFGTTIERFSERTVRINGEEYEIAPNLRYFNAEGSSNNLFELKTPRGTTSVTLAGNPSLNQLLLPRPSQPPQSAADTSIARTSSSSTPNLSQPSSSSSLSTDDALPFDSGRAKVNLTDTDASSQPTIIIPKLNIKSENDEV